MPAKEIAGLVAQELRREGMDIPVTARPSNRFANPSAIEFTVNGTSHQIEFWEGSQPDQDVADRIFLGVLCEVWGTPLHETRGRLDHERSRRAA